MHKKHRTDPTLEPPGTDGPGARRPCRPAEARWAVVRAVTERCRATATPYDTEALADAQLVASELTTNALLHGGGVTDFRVEVDAHGVRVCVSDRSDRLPHRRPSPAGDRRRRPGGHGWPLVCRLAREVQVTALPTGGKRITAVVPLTGMAPA
jgi:anti-sigma regulatory factor (Ser/Thr protein kinase)